MLKRPLLALLLAFCAAVAAHAQTFPARPVKILVPFPPGGGIDVLVRAMAAELSPKWGQAVVIENRPGAGGNIGAELVARAEPDGHTLLATVNQTFTSNRYLYKALPFDPDRSFLPVTLMVQGDHFLLANPALAAKDVRELVALAKAQPGKLTFGSFGSGSQPHLVYVTLNKREGLDLLHVPYKGIAPLLAALVAGEVNLGTGSAGVAGQLIKAGRVKALAVAGKQRAAQFPDVPTTAEAGYPYLLASIWFGLFAPAGTPAAVIDRVSGDARALLKTSAFAEKHVTSKGLEVVASTPAELAAAIREESVSVGEMIRAANVQAE